MADEIIRKYTEKEDFHFLQHQKGIPSLSLSLINKKKKVTHTI